MRARACGEARSGRSSKRQQQCAITLSAAEERDRFGAYSVPKKGGWCMLMKSARDGAVTEGGGGLRLPQTCPWGVNGRGHHYHL